MSLHRRLHDTPKNLNPSGAFAPLQIAALPPREPVGLEVPQRPDDTRAIARTVLLLRGLLVAVGLAGLISVYVVSILPTNRLLMQVMSGITVIGAGVLLWLLHKNWVQLVAHGVVALLFVMVTGMELILPGRLGAVTATHLFVLLLAGAVTNPRVLITMTLGSIATVICVTLIRYPTHFDINQQAQLDALSYCILFVLMGVAVSLTQRGLNKALASSEYYFEFLIRTSRDVVVVIGKDHIIQYDSPAIQRVLGYLPSQRVGHSWTEYVHPEDVASLRQVWDNLILTPDNTIPPLLVRALHADGSWIDTECAAQPIQDQNDPRVTNLLISMRDIRLRKQTEAKLGQRLAFEQVVADVSSQFMALPPEQVDEGIQYALQRVGEFMDVDLCLLFQISDDRTLNVNTHEWCAPGIASQKARRQKLPLSAEGGWWLNELTTRGIICFANLHAALPADIPDDVQRALRAKGLWSLMSVPIARRGIILGELGLDSYHKPIQFSEENIQLLRVVAELIGGAIERQRAALALQAERNSLEQRVNARTHELHQLLEMTHTMSMELALQPLLELVLVGLKRTVGYTSAAIAELPDGVHVSTLVADGPDADRRMRTGAWTYDLEHDLHLREMVERHVPVIIPDVNADTPFAAAHRARYLRTIGETPPYLRSSMYLPLISRDQYIGHVAVHSEIPGYFNSARVELAFAFARQAAVAIENARLHEEARHSAAMMERRRLARELHDSVSQALFGIVLGARTALQLGANTPAVSALKYVLDLSEGAQAEMRALIFELRPESLQTEGLLVALDKQSEALAARHNLVVHLQVGEQEPLLGIEAKEALYRITLEAIQNTIKHAHATEVTLSMKIEQAIVTLEIADNGHGFDPAKLVHGHYGLRIMRERAEQFGGAVTIRSTPDQGTRVAVTVPCAPVSTGSVA